MSRVLMGSLLITLLFFGCKSSGDQKKANVPYDSIRTAIKALDLEIGEGSSDPNLHFRRSQLFYSDRQLDQALHDINKAIALDKTSSEFYILLSDIYLLMGQPQNCGEALDQALSIEPQNKAALLKKAKLNLIAQDYRKTFESIKKLLAIDKINPDAYYTRGIAFLEYGDTAAAVNDLLKAVEQNQQYYEAYVQLGELYALRKDPMAEMYFRNALNIRPKSKEALYMLGMYYQETEKFDKAIAVYQNFAQADTTVRNAPFNIGYIYLVYLKDFKKAASFFTLAIERDSTYFEAWYNRGLAYELMGDFDKAYKDYQVTLKIETNYPKAIEGLNRLDRIRLNR